MTLPGLLLPFAHHTEVRMKNRSSFRILGLARSAGQQFNQYSRNIPEFELTIKLKIGSPSKMNRVSGNGPNKPGICCRQALLNTIRDTYSVQAV